MKIFVIDTGYSGPYQDVVSDKPDATGHGTSMINLIKSVHKKAVVFSIRLELNATIKEIDNIFQMVEQQAMKNDVVVLPWVTKKNLVVDNHVILLSRKCTVIMAAGNSSSDVINFSPAGCGAGIVVGSINKSGLPTKSTNFSALPNMRFMFGTNISSMDHAGNPIVLFGTSPAACLYAALISRSRKFTNADRAFNRFFNVLCAKFQREITNA